MNRNVTAIILIALALGIFFTYTQGAWNQAMAVKAVNDRYASAIATAQQLISVRDKVLADYNSISPTDRDNLDKMIPSTVDNIRLIIDLNSVALKHGFPLQNIKAAASNSSSASASARGSATVSVAPGLVLSAAAADSSVPSIPMPTLDTVDISFNVTAPYEQFISFMQDLEANLRVMDVTHLSMTATDSGTYSFSVQLRTYWLRQ